MAVRQRDIAPSNDESSRGVLALRVFVYWCQDPDCRRKQMYTQELYAMGIGTARRVKKQDEAKISKRLQQANESDWVWSWHRETYGKVKWTVK